VCLVWEDVELCDSRFLFVSKSVAEEKGVLTSVLWNVCLLFKAFRFSSLTMGLRVLGSRWGRRDGSLVVPGVKYGWTG
jgi:hypothetical protein